MRLLAVIIIGVLLSDLFCSSEAWLWGQSRRRRRRCAPPSTTKIKWFNSWNQAFTFTCPSGQAITEIHSLYSSCDRDRVFRFACRWNKAVAKGRRCHWSHYANDFDQLVAFKCPYSGFVTGIRSYHDNHYRRFKLRCCAHPRFHRYHCSSGSHFLNQWRKPLDFKAPQNYFLVGATGYHDSGQEYVINVLLSCKSKASL